MEQEIKNNLSDAEFDKLFEDSREALIKRRAALSDEERRRIDNNLTLERWVGETETTNQGKE